MAPPVAWQTHPPQRSPEVPVKGLRARPEGRPGHGRLGVAHTEMTGFTCRGAGRSPSGVPCRWLAALHDAGYLHGDVKPSNIGFTAGGSPKLLDFGLARGAGSAAAGGTLRYASPEILSDRPAGEGDDVWSLCVVLYEMVSGEHPFAGGSADEVARR